MPSQNTPNPTNQKDKPIGWHIVAVFDLLGQKEALRKLTVLPTPDNLTELDEFKRKVADFYVPLYAIRTFFTSSIKKFQEGSTDINQLALDKQDMLKEFRSTPIFVRHFSDSIIVHVPLKEDLGKFPCVAIYGVLAAAALTMVSCLANKIVFRGGIELGLAMILDKNEIYGPALARAHTLEDKVAQYPRIVIGEEIIRYLRDVVEQPLVSDEERVHAMLAARSAELLEIDDDGQVFLDYLGEHFRDQFQHLPAFKEEAVKPAYNFIIEQSIKHKEAMNSKLGFRYTLMRNYFESRLSFWGLTTNRRS